jgi:hypothetical protein
MAGFFMGDRVAGLISLFQLKLGASAYLESASRYLIDSN